MSGHEELVDTTRRVREWLTERGEYEAVHLIEAQAERIAELERERDAAVRMRKEAESSRTGAEVERDELRADFLEYAHHLESLPSCRANPGPTEMTGKCTCGLDAARARHSIGGHP